MKHAFFNSESELLMTTERRLVMKTRPYIHILPLLALLTLAGPLAAQEETPAPEKLAPRHAPPAAGPDLDLTDARVRHLDELDLLVFEATVAGEAGGTSVAPAGQLDGAPVLGYVFPTDLEPEDVWFGPTEGTVALAVTAHPDFDDTPLWDENGDRVFDNDGVTWHTHWVVLTPDERVPGDLAVKEMREEEMATVLPPTNPGMPMYMDSPGFAVLTRGDTLRVLVPAQRVHDRKNFHFDAVTAYMEVDTRDRGPMLGVYKVYEVLSGDLSLPYRVTSDREFSTEESKPN